MKRLLFAIAALSLLATSIPASAGNCNRNPVTGQQTCNTYCW